MGWFAPTDRGIPIRAILDAALAGIGVCIKGIQNEVHAQTGDFGDGLLHKSVVFNVDGDCYRMRARRAPSERLGKRGSRRQRFANLRAPGASPVRSAATSGARTAGDRI